MKTDTNEQVHHALKSIEKMSRAEASPFLYGKILERMKQYIPEPVYYTGKAVLRLAVVVIMIAVVNVVTVKIARRVPGPAVNEQSEIQRVAQEYFGADRSNTYPY